MYQHGHYGAALLAYAPVAFVTTAAGFIEVAVFGGVGVVALSMLPDADQRVPFVRHRGPTHTVSRSGSGSPSVVLFSVRRGAVALVAVGAGNAVATTV